MSETLCPVLPLLRTRLGVSPSPATIWRWTRRGVGGVTLRTVRVGKRLFSSERWVAEFIAQQQATASPEPTSPTAPRSANEAAALRAAGLLADCPPRQ